LKSGKARHGGAGAAARLDPSCSSGTTRAKLGDVVLLEAGSRPRGGASKSGRGVPSIGGEHLTAGGRFDFARVKHVPERFYLSMRQGRIRGRDVLLVKDGATIGKASLVTPAFPFARACVNEHVFILRPKDPSRLRPEYLFCLLRTSSMQARIRQRVSGSAQGGLTKRALMGILISVPSPTEQARIASILSNVDALVGNTEGAIESYERLKYGLVRMLIRPVRAGGVSIENNAKDWRKCPLASLGKIVGGGTPSTKNPDYWGGGIPWATPTDVTRLESNFILKTNRSITKTGLGKSAARLLPKHSILITTRATIGELAINAVPMATNQGFHSLCCNRETDFMFAFYLIQRHRSRFSRYADGTTFLEIGKTDLDRIKVQVPSTKPKQQRIASILSGVDAVIENYRLYQQQLERLKRGLMQKLLSGKIRV